jgi:hypothetical protein
MKKRVLHLADYKKRQSIVIMECKDLLDLCAIVQELDRTRSCYDELGALCQRNAAYARLSALLGAVNTQARHALDAPKGFSALQIDVTGKRYPGGLAQPPESLPVPPAEGAAS